jgi:DNA mismatch repair protein MutS
MIVTGPNAAGKSTFIKSIILNVLMSQTLGIACATEFSLTPFYFINSQINIPDSKGVESLFEAEMYRCKYNLDIVKDIPKTRKAIVIMDELFNSTNVVEGVSAGYSILNKLSSYKNVLTILTTHYPYLTKVPNFVRYKIDATIDKENTDSINYNYKLSKGLSKQYLALRILKKNDFDPDLIEFAKQIQKRILV